VCWAWRFSFWFCAAMSRKIDFAINAVSSLVEHLHMQGDRCMLATFNHEFRIVQPFTTNEPTVHAGLQRIRNTEIDGGTRLYDSIVDTVNEFRNRADRSRPWFLVVVTDGNDGGNGKFNAGTCGDTVLRTYNHEHNNFVFAVGVGDDVNRQQLAILGDRGRFSAMHIDAFPLLELAFMNIALKVTTQLRGAVISNGAQTWAAVQQQRSLVHVPIDYAFVIDVSGSMNADVHTPLSCFSGHQLSRHDYGAVGTWYCDRCGADVTSRHSDHHCTVCSFDACRNCVKDVRELRPVSSCRNRHPLRYGNGQGSSWRCDECSTTYASGKRLRCINCDYDMCEKCLVQERLVALICSN